MLTLNRAAILLFAGLMLALSTTGKATETAPNPQKVLATEMQEVPLLFLFLGQSNMVGQGARREHLPGELHAIPQGCKFYWRGTRLESFADRVCFGPEVSFAQELSEQLNGRPFIIHMWAAGGTSIQLWMEEPDEEKMILVSGGNQAPDPIFPKIVATMKDVEAHEGSFEVAGIFWMQGERDAKFEWSAMEYGERLGELVESLRQEFAMPETPFIFGQINPVQDPHFPFSPIVREAQDLAQSIIPNSKMISTDEFTLVDAAHFDAPSQLLLGERFGAAYLEMSDVEHETGRISGVAHDPIDYPIGSLAGNGSGADFGFMGEWSIREAWAAPQVVEGTLSFTDSMGEALPVEGNRIGNIGQSIAWRPIDMSRFPGGVIYFSFLFRGNEDLSESPFVVGFSKDKAHHNQYSDVIDVLSNVQGTSINYHNDPVHSHFTAVYEGDNPESSPGNSRSYSGYPLDTETHLIVGRVDFGSLPSHRILQMTGG